jgi:hypothetical protein
MGHGCLLPVWLSSWQKHTTAIVRVRTGC